MNKSQINHKLLNEFYQFKNSPETILSSFDAVLVFCGQEVTVSGENKLRILTALKLTKKIKNGVLIFLGTKNHNNNFKKFLAKKSIKLPILYPCTRPHASTRTQVIDLAKFLKKKPFNNLLIVSHSYHLPRVARYCKKHLAKLTEYDFFGIGEIQNQQKQVEKEIEKIIKYHAKGYL